MADVKCVSQCLQTPCWAHAQHAMGQSHLHEPLLEEAVICARHVRPNEVKQSANQQGCVHDAQRPPPVVNKSCSQ